MGDVLSIVEKAAAEMSMEEANRLKEKAKNAKFDFDDFLQQSKAVANMGSLGKVAKMMPGMSGISTEQLIAAEKRLKKNEATMIKAMSAEERGNPDLLIRDKKSRERIQRIAKDSGFSVVDVKGFMSEFQKMRTMMSCMTKMGDAINPEIESSDGEMMMPRNRAAHRASKKKKQAGRGGGGRFG
jgi:signal recognition particle subunit SRP54